MIIKKIFFALILGCIATVYFAQFDQWIHNKIAHAIRASIEQSSGCRASFTLDAVHFFQPSLIVKDVEVEPLHSAEKDLMVSSDNGEWRWKCKKITIESSWIQCLVRSVMNSAITLDEFEGESLIKDGSVALFSFIAPLMQETVPGIDITSVAFNNGTMTVHEPTTDIRATFSFDSSSLKSFHYKTMASVKNGSLVCNGAQYVENGSAHIVVEMPADNCNAQNITMRLTGTFKLTHLPTDDLCSITGSLTDSSARFSLATARNTISIDPLIITADQIGVQAHLPLAYIYNCIHNSNSASVAGNCRVCVKIGTDEQRKVDGLCVVEDVAVNSRTVCDVATCMFARRYTDWKTKTTLKSNQLYASTILVESTGNTGTYAGTIDNHAHATTHHVQGTCTYEDGTLHVHTDCDSHECDIHLLVSPHVQLRSCTYKDPEKNLLVTLNSTDPNKVTGELSFSLFHTLVQRFLGYDMQGEGALSFSGNITAQGLEATIALARATIRLPQTYNFINGFKTHVAYYWQEQICSWDNLVLSLHTGTISCPHAVIHFDDVQNIRFIHVPLLFDHCLFNITKDFFATLSGNLLLSQQADQHPCINAHFIIDRAQLKENLFSSTLQKQLFVHTHAAFSLPDVPVACDVVIETSSPVRVDAPFLQTNAHMNVRIQKKVAQDPTIVGTVNLFSGILAFPYKPLHITRGSLVFTGYPYDPAIELTARNKVKKYDIALQVSGSLSSHHIIFDSTPPLSEEQIVALLLTGSEDDLLNSMMPALIAHNVKNLIFSNNQNHFLRSYYKPLRPFSINFIPSFTDQTGRGGLRAALELSAQDRWRAVIQKNFTLTEDTRFEYEYLLSDDIMFRAVRDERRDLGAEVEMRWKF